MKFFILLVSLVTNIAYAYEVDKVSSGDTLESIATRNIDRVWMRYSDPAEYTKDIIKWNPQVQDWNNLKKNQIIYVDYPYTHFTTGSTWAPDLEVFEDPNEFNKRFSLGAFYSSSFGTYDELTTEQSVKSNQNFPVTLGMGFSVSNVDKEHFLTGSGYWAKASKGKISSNSEENNTEIEIPGETGVNVYYQYFLKDLGMGFYTGYDFEKLNTFNTYEMIEGEPIQNIDNKIHYGTIGGVKTFSPFDLNMNLKASVSKTISSTTSGNKKLTGMKYIINYTYKPEGRFSFNVFYKHHSLKGSTDLSISRIGLSIGLAIF
jgi:hypothetical protein